MTERDKIIRISQEINFSANGLVKFDSMESIDEFIH